MHNYVHVSLAIFYSNLCDDSCMTLYVQGIHVYICKGECICLIVLVQQLSINCYNYVFSLCI